MTIAAVPSPTKFIHSDNALLSLLPTGGTETYFNFATVDMKDTLEAADTTNSGGNGWGDVTAGVRRISGTLKFVYDLGNKPHLTPYQIKTGTTLQVKVIIDAQAANNLLSSDVTTPTGIWFGQALVTETSFSPGPSNGALNMSMTFMSKGPWTVPTT
jgi:hypothetical protein